MPGKRKSHSFSPPVDVKTLHKNLDFTATEQYKLLRANLSFTLPEDVTCPIIGVTSSMRGEGKSTTSINLSYVLAESGKRVLLIDCDLRIPSIAKKLGLETPVGLTHLLCGGDPVSLGTFKYNEFANWYIIPSGNLPPNPSELLGSRRMENVLNALSENFDFIILDLPPVGIVSDALAVSKYLTGMIVVVRMDHTEKRELENSVRLFKLSNVNVLGFVLNDSKSGGGRYRYKKYRYKNYRYGYGYGYGYGSHRHNDSDESVPSSESQKPMEESDEE